MSRQYFNISTRGGKSNDLRTAEECCLAVRGLCVVLAEDHEVNAELLIEDLESLGVLVTHALTGVGAVAAAFCTPRPDVILMDCHMPEMDGFEATVQIRAEERRRALAAIPILAITALTFDFGLERCLSIGMNGYLVKPFSTNDLAMALCSAIRAGT